MASFVPSCCFVEKYTLGVIQLFSDAHSGIYCPLASFFFKEKVNLSSLNLPLFSC